MKSRSQYFLSEGSRKFSDERGPELSCPGFLASHGRTAFFGVPPGFCVYSKLVKMLESCISEVGVFLITNRYSIKK